MRHRKVFLLLFSGGLAISLYYLAVFLRDFGNLPLSYSRIRWWWVIAAIPLHLSAHWLRAAKSRLLIDPIRKAKPRQLFNSMAIGFLHNALLPFRMGELVRAHTLGKVMSISRVAVFMTILMERAIDGFILSIATLFLALALFWSDFGVQGKLLTIAITIFAASLLICVLIYLISSQPRFALMWLSRATAIFNDRLRDQCRFHLWSAGYSIRLVLARARLGLFVCLSLLMWILYGSAIWVLALSVMPDIQSLQRLLLVAASYLSVSVPSGPAYLGTYHFFFTDLTSSVLQRTGALLEVSVLSWAFMIVPISLIGAYVLLTWKPESGVAENPDGDPRANKLLRYKDISVDLSEFLEMYFSCRETTHILSESELSDDFRLIRILQGGSNAETVLARNGDRAFVRKLSLSRHSAKLARQYAWLAERQRFGYFPKLIGEGRTESAYYYDLQYANDYVTFFEYIHANSAERSEAIIGSILDMLSKDLYSSTEAVSDLSQVREYISVKVTDKVQDACAMHSVLAALSAPPKLVVNSIEYDNLLVAITKILTDDAILNDLCNYVPNPIHGDLTVDNILVGDSGFLLLDPNDENLISDMVVDVGKLYQSLHSGYEFLRNLSSVSVEDNRVVFEESVSSKYAGLFTYLDSLLRDRLPEHRYRSILFHEAVHYCRMLPYRVRLNPSTAPVFYAVAVRLFNQFLAQYATAR